MLGTSWTYIDNWHEDEMMNFFIFILFADEFICSKCLLGKSKVKIASHKCQELHGQFARRRDDEFFFGERNFCSKSLKIHL